jgi:hypothetical protein
VILVQLEPRVHQDRMDSQVHKDLLELRETKGHQD